MTRVLHVVSALCLAGAGVAAANDYPTEARASYVFGCMAVNGQTPEALRKCSCAVDVIATILPYDAYVAAETVLTMRQTSGERSTLFRDTAPANATVADLRRAEAEAEIICF
ncbi:hypothetical protein [Tabrizicola aquatica]|jgi:hypothetical protein|uniref:hypothetical protein n=1 Tax=Tabrizicola aquatica TaxID=909926 RepID=UPI000CD2837B|nr:hypothetical protein [Tabrizicola aquatica]